MSVPRAITGYGIDAQGDWVAQLSCGHTQHVRHRPPLQPQAWVTTAQGRQARLGTTLPCLYCTMPVLPNDVTVVRATAEFTADTMPRALRRDHRTRADTWGRIVVREGVLLFALAAPATDAWALRVGIPGIIEPGVAHRVTPQGAVRFFVEFLRRRSPSR